MYNHFLYIIFITDRCFIGVFFSFFSNLKFDPEEGILSPFARCTNMIFLSIRSRIKILERVVEIGELARIACNKLDEKIYHRIDEFSSTWNE